MSLTRWSRFLGFATRQSSNERSSHRKRRNSRSLLLELLEDRTLLASPGLGTALPIDPTGSVAENLRTPGEVDSFQLTLPDSGRLTAQVQPVAAGSLNTRLSLLGPDGKLLIQSDGQSAASPDDLIDQHLVAGTYFLEVAGLGTGTGAYTLTTQFQPATPPFQPLPVDFNPETPGAFSPRFSVVGDFNGDGILDIATANFSSNDVSVLVGNGDGTFQAARNFPVGPKPVGIVAADFNRDGHLDLAVADEGSNEISVLLGRGDGTFAPEVRYACGDFPGGLATADLNGDGFLDLVSANQNSRDLSVLLGRGDGTFQKEMRIPVGKPVFDVGIGDFNGDGHPDLVATYATGGASVLLGRGDGTFQEPVSLPGDLSSTGGYTTEVATGDFNGDGRLDVALTDPSGKAVVVFLGRGDGTFQSEMRYAVGSGPAGVVAGDFNGDGHLDLATANVGSNDVSVLLGWGDGTFQDQVRYQVGLSPWGVMIGDFNGDGRLDLATANGLSHDVSLLLGLGNGTFQQNPLRRLGADNPQSIVTGDFNGDGILDLATTSYTSDQVSVFLGQGDGTFQRDMRFPVGSTPFALVAGDFNGDGHLDLATANCNSGDVSILLGRGNGTFQAQARYPVGFGLTFAVAGDFNGDGNLDLLVGGQYSNLATVLLGRGDGTFTQVPEQIQFAPGDGPFAVAVGDFNGDGKLDLVVTHVLSSDHAISVYEGNGDGTFQAPRRYTVGSQPEGVVAGDFDGRHYPNGKPILDLAVTNFGSNSVSVLLGRGDGTFQDPVQYATGGSPESIVAADFNGDGKLDLAVTNKDSPDVSILLGRGDGTFLPEERYLLGDKPTPHIGIVAGDFNGDGHLDLATSQLLTNDIAVLQGTGDGRFQAPLHVPVGFGPSSLVTGDFNGDGRIDVAGAQPETNEVSIALGNGDATLQNSVRLPVGMTPVSIVKGDFNRDGRLDLATANFGSNDVSVLLGLGDGTFRQEVRYAVDANPVSLVTGDFNSDGVLDLAVADSGSNDVSILFGRGDGTFGNEIRLAAGDLPQAIVAGDFSGDGHLDLAVANYRSKDIWVYLGRGDGTFQDPLKFPLGESPISLVAADSTGNGILDLATANYLSNDVQILRGRGDGTFLPSMRFEAGTNPVTIIVGDFDGDGHLDLATANSGSQDVTVLRGRGDGTFAAPHSWKAGNYPAALAVGDFNSDGFLDLALGSQLASEVSIMQGVVDATGKATFVAGGTIANPFHATPVVADLNGDGLPDVAVVDRQGKILLRLARPGQPGVFEAPVIVNPDPLPGARDLALVSTRQGPVLAALDAKGSSLSLYARGSDGNFQWYPGPKMPLGTLPVALAAGDLNGDGLTDLVVALAGCDDIFVYLQSPLAGGPAAGLFGPNPNYRLHVGVSPSAIQLVDVDGDGRRDIVVTNQFSGDVSVFNAGSAGFAPELRFRAGTGLYGLDSSTGQVRSRQEPAGIVAGKFNDNLVDLIVTHSGTNSFALLRGDGAGGFLNPEQAPSFLTGLRPTAVVAGRFTSDPYLDLAILNQESGDISIFLGDGHGGFTETVARDANGQPIRLSAGYLPTGLAVADINGDGKLDLLVGNDFGDVLILLGNGDGTFQPYQRAERKVALAVADLTGKGTDDLIFADQSLDRVMVQYAQPGQSFVQGRTDGLLAPGAVRVADLNGDGIPDLIVANSGGNDVLVYLGLGNGQFGPAQKFFTGTNPAGVTVASLNDDAILDPTDQTHQRLIDPTPDLVVANAGSNDVTVLLGQGQGATWTLEPGPRLDAHGSGPVSTVVRYVPDPKGGAAIPDLLVANSQSNTATLVPGVGGGFFDDRTQSIQNFATGSDPQQVLVGNFVNSNELDLITVNAGSNDLTLFRNFGPGQSVGSGGDVPVAALAGDFRHDGLTDLLVANNGNGAISLLLAGADGPTLFKVFSRADVVHPTDLAMGEDPSVFYVSQEGEETAARFTLQFGIAVPGGPGGQELREPIADVLPLRDNSLAIVATLVTVAQDSRTIRSDMGEILVAVVAGPHAAPAADSGKGEEDIPQDAAMPETDAASNLPSFVIGLDEAFERAGAERRKGLFPSGRPALPAEWMDSPLDEVRSKWLPLIADELGNAARLLTDTLLDVLKSSSLPLTRKPTPTQPVPAVPQGKNRSGGSTSVTPVVPAEPKGIETPAPRPREEGQETPSRDEAGWDLMPLWPLMPERRHALTDPLAAALVACGAFMNRQGAKNAKEELEKKDQRARGVRPI